MLSILKPRETSFFEFFERHAQKTIEGARLFHTLTVTGTDLVAGTDRIKELEHETDVITHSCIQALHRTFITPFDRDAIHRLITHMDDVIDFVEAASDRLALYELSPATPELRSLAEVLVRATEEVEQAVLGLRDMKRAGAVLDRCRNVGRIENEGDRLLRAAVAKLFREETDAVTMFKWKEVYEDLENATDRCQDVANVIEGVVLEHA